MREPHGTVLPVLLQGLLPVRLPAGCAADILLDGTSLGSVETAPGGPERKHFVPVPVIRPGAVLRVIDRNSGADLEGSPVTLLPPERTGRVEGTVGRFIFGAVDAPGDSHEATVLAFVDGEAVAYARARRADPGARHLNFVLLLPMAVTEGRPAFVHLALAGGSGTFDGGPIPVGSPDAHPASRRLRRVERPLRMAIKIAAPDMRQALQWGDYHFARALRVALERLGWVVDIHTQDRWYGGDPVDVDLVLRGRQRYRTDPGRTNLMWLISHPDRMADDEPAEFDHVFVASDIYLPTFRKRYGVPCSTLHQATDPAVFVAEPAPRMETPLLFVGNSRREYRTMVRWCIEKRLPLGIWGGMWEGIVPPHFLRGTHIPNENLAAAYSGAGVLLNDHWDTMRDNGFLSNRLFDGSATGTPILTDPVAGLAEVFGDTIQSVSDADDLAVKAEAILADPDAARARALRAREIVLAGHTFDHRARTIVEIVTALGASRKAEERPPQRRTEDARTLSR